MSRLHLVSTGGTIGSLARNGELVPGAAPESILSLLSGHDIQWTSPFEILSENATSSHWSDLARHVAALAVPEVDGIVVTHGSDTLAWSTAALAFALRGIPVPVVFVAGDRPLSDPTSNGPANLRAACDFVSSERLPGVFACWTNPGERPAIHLGARLLPADRSDRFHSGTPQPLGWMEDGSFRRHPAPWNPTRAGLAESERGTWNGSKKSLGVGALFSDRVLVLPDHPGLDHAPLIETIGSWDGVFQVSHHSGTASAADSDGSFLRLVRAATERGIPVAIGPGRDLSTPYASRRPLQEAGARFLAPGSWSALATKFRYLLARDVPKDGPDLDRSLCWEHPEECTDA